MNLYLRLLDYVRPYWFRLLVATGCAAGVSILTAAFAWLVRPVLDNIFIQRDMDLLVLLPLLVMVLALVKGAMSFGQIYLMEWVGSRIVMDIRKRLYHHLIFLPLGFYVKNPTGTLMSRVLSDVSLIQISVSTVVKNLFQQCLTVLALLGVMFYQDWKLASIAVFLLPAAYFPVVRMGARVRRLSKTGQEKIADMSSTLGETFSGIRLVKAFGNEQYETERFHSKNKHYFKNVMRITRVSGLVSPLMEFFGTVGVALVILYGGYHVIEGTMTPGTFTSFMAACLMMYNPVRMLSRSYTAIQQALGAAERVFTTMDLETEEDRKEGNVVVSGIESSMEFEGVSFQYEDSHQHALDQINLSVRAGESIALVGSSGSGKTTLANLIPRFFNPTRGRILIDGKDIRNFTLSSLRRLIGVVGQEIVLFDDTVRNNVAYGNNQVSQDEIHAATQSAFAHEFITRMPDGYQTTLGENGVKLSVGERQRISIARVFLKNTPILILDEATSALDPASEEIVQKALYNLMQNRTTFVIAHRLSTIEQVHRIVVLERGRIVEVGTHKELLKKNGVYRQLYRKQFEVQEKYVG